MEPNCVGNQLCVWGGMRFKLAMFKIATFKIAMFKIATPILVLYWPIRVV